MDALEAMRSRRSVREFSDKPIPKEAIEQMVDCGRLAPTARGEEPWEFVVVTDKAMLRTLGEVCDHGPFLRDAAAALVISCRETKYYLEDGCAATENILVAASALGLGACWVAGDKKPYAERVRGLLGLPGGHKLISILALGYPEKPPAVKKKRSLSSVLHWGSYRAPERP